MAQLVQHPGKSDWFRCTECRNTVKSEEHNCDEASHVVSNEEETAAIKGAR